MEAEVEESLGWRYFEKPDSSILVRPSASSYSSLLRVSCSCCQITEMRLPLVHYVFRKKLGPRLQHHLADSQQECNIGPAVALLAAAHSGVIHS